MRVRTISSIILVGAMMLLLSCGKNLLSEARESQSKGDIASLEVALEKYDEVLYDALNAVAGQYDVQVLLAIKYAEAKNYNACIERLQEAREIKATDANLYYYLGLCYTHLAQTTNSSDDIKALAVKAQNSFEQGLEYDDKNPLLYYGQGILSGFVLDKVEDAIKFLEQAYELEPYDLNVLFALGNLYYRINKVENSKRFYREVMDKTPKDSPKWMKAQKNLAQIKAR